MKNFLIRLAIYIPVESFLWWVFVPDFFAPNLFPGSVFAHLPGYMAYYGITYGFWIFAYEAVYHAAKAFRKPKPVPETQPLSAINRSRQALDAQAMAELREIEARERNN